MPKIKRSYGLKPSLKLTSKPKMKSLSVNTTNDDLSVVILNATVSFLNNRYFQRYCHLLVNKWLSFALLHWQNYPVAFTL